MSPAVLALVLLSAVVHAAWNLWIEQLGPGVRSVPLLWLLTAISAVGYAPFALASLGAGSWRPGGWAVALTLGSGVIHVGYFALLLRGYRTADFSLVYPLARGTGPLLAAAGAVALFGERPAVLSVTGTLLIAAGVLGIALLSPLSYILILLALRTGDVSRVAPAREVSILFGAWLGGVVLGEGQRRRRLAAAAAFAAGVAALALD
jgi:uncharacterized membrane protein